MDIKVIEDTPETVTYEVKITKGELGELNSYDGEEPLERYLFKLLQVWWGN